MAVPKFGEWDEKNPRSAEGFTEIFNKMKEEKQIAAAKFPSVSVQHDVNKYHESSHKENTRGKVCTGTFKFVTFPSRLLKYDLDRYICG